MAHLKKLKQRSLIVIYHRTLTVGGSIIVQLVSSFTRMDSAASLHTNNHIFSFLGSNPILFNWKPAVH